MAKQVLHITDFQDLYELTDDVRKSRSGPLRYTRSLVTLSPFSPDAESRHFERLHRLKAKPERHLLRSVFEDLKNWVAAKPYGLRGFIVNTDGKAATSEYLAEQLSMSVEDLKQALPILLGIGFLERVPVSSQQESTRSKKRKSARKSRKTGQAKKTVKKTKHKTERKAQNTEKHTVECPTKRLLDSAGMKRKVGARLRVTAKAKAKNKGKVNQKANNGLTAVKGKEKENGIAHSHNAKAQGKGRSQGQGKAEPSSAPTTTPPMSCRQPSESDARGDSRVIHFAGSPQGSVNLSKAGISYGRRVYLALGYRHDIDSSEAAREIASFASKHDTVCSRLSDLSPPVVDGVLNRGLREAGKIPKRKASRNPGAIWNSLMDKLAQAKLCEDKAGVQYA